MKKTVITFGMVILFTGVLLIFCGQSPNPAKLQLSSHSDSLSVQKLREPDSPSAYETFRELTLLKIGDNEKALLRLHAEIGNKNEQAKARYFSVLLVLRHRNNALKARVMECDQHNWIAFEHTLLSDIEQLEHAIADFRLAKEIVI